MTAPPEELHDPPDSKRRGPLWLLVVIVALLVAGLAIDQVASGFRTARKVAAPVDPTAVVAGAGVAFRCRDLGNCWWVQAVPVFRTWNITRVVDGDVSFMGNLGSASVDSGTTIEVKSRGDRLTFSVDGVPRRTIVDGSLRRATGAGLMMAAGYFGPWPALLRLPVAALTDRFDGRLTQPSMLLAFVVALFFTARLAWRIRALVLPDAPLRRAEQWAIGGFAFVVGSGSVLMFLGADLLVFHEAAIWGAALAIGALEFVVAFTVTARRRAICSSRRCSRCSRCSRGRRSARARWPPSDCCCSPPSWVGGASWSGSPMVSRCDGWCSRSRRRSSCRWRCTWRSTR